MGSSDFLQNQCLNHTQQLSVICRTYRSQGKSKQAIELINCIFICIFSASLHIGGGDRSKVGGRIGLGRGRSDEVEVENGR